MVVKHLGYSTVQYMSSITAVLPLVHTHFQIDDVLEVLFSWTTFIDDILIVMDNLTMNLSSVF